MEREIELVINDMHKINNLQKINEHKNKIETYISKKADITGKLSPEGSLVKTLTQERDKLEEKLAKLVVPIRAVLGTSTVSVSEFVDLQVGDVIKLDADAKGTIKVMVGDIYKFDAKPGINRKRNSVLITKVIKNQQQDEDDVGKGEINV